MKRKEPSSAVDDETDLKRPRTVLFDDGKSRVTAVTCTSFPEAVSRILGDYLSGSEREYVVAALVGVQPITLCLSQDVDSPLGTCWSMGFLPPEHQWGSWDAKIDKQLPITDVEGCLSFLDQTNSNDCRIVIEVLVVKLSMTSSGSSSVLDDLRNTIGELQGHLSSIKHVVFAITEYFYCCFSLKNATDKETGISLPVNHQQVLLQMIDDLETCWSVNRTLTPVDLFAFYFTIDVQRASEMHLAKFVISLNHPLSQALFRQEAPRLVSHKMMWVFFVKSDADFHFVDQDTTRYCHAIHVGMDMSAIKKLRPQGLVNRLKSIFCYRDNRFIERIVIKSLNCGRALQLAWPRVLPTDTIPVFALRELTLESQNNTLDLKELNNGYFPQLTRLSVVGGQITGHLNKHCVPRLKKLVLDPGRVDSRLLVYRHIKSVIRSNRPWQLVASRENGGWSLASYDEPITHAQVETKEDLSHGPLYSLPLIRELLLYVSCQENVNEWQSRLNGDPSFNASTADHTDGLLLWEPQCVQKITAFSYAGLRVKLGFDFRMGIPGQTRLLTSLTCYRFNIVLDGAVLPHLQLLDLNDGRVMLSGAFPQLETLSWKEIELENAWELGAPLLQSFTCDESTVNENLIIRPHLLPKLSSLQIMSRTNCEQRCPKILVDEDGLGLSHVKRVVFETDMYMSTYSDRWQLNNVPDLELTLNPWDRPKCWWNTVWQCETLTINIIYNPADEDNPQPAVVLPPLPQVKRLTVTNNMWRVLLNSEMPKLTDCSVPSPFSLGPNLRCPALKRMRFTHCLRGEARGQCLDPATYEAMGARPKFVYFDHHGTEHKMTWDSDPNVGESIPVVGPLEDGDDSFVS